MYFEPDLPIVFVILIGFVAGGLVGATGVGGAAFATPALVLGLGLPAPVAIATDAVFCAVIKLVGLGGHRREAKKTTPFGEHRRVFITLLLGSVPGALLGALTLRFVAAGPLSESVLRRLLGVLLIVAAGATLYRLFRRRESSATITQELNPILLGLSAAVLGFLVGLTSIGAGSLFLPLLLLTVAAPFRRLVALDLAQGLVLAVVVGGFHLSFGLVKFPLLALLIVGGVPGALAGARLHGVVSSRALVSATASLIALVGARLVF